MQKNVEVFGINDKRGRVETSTDPYRMSEGLKEPARCRICQAVYHNKRWQAASSDMGESEARLVVCPACRKAEEGYVQGVLTLRGDYVLEHEDEIRNVLQNAELHSTERNPMERIMRIDRDGDMLVIETSAERLAEQLGRALHRSLHGELKIQWSADHDVCRVNWQRDA